MGQRIDIEQRLDKLDYSFCFNDAFLEAVIKKQDWYLFDYQDAPKVWDAFYTASVDEYLSVVQQHIDNGVPHKTVKALDLIKHLLIIRQETGRMYCFNVSRANTHTPFVDVVKLSNLCVAPETQILTDQGYMTIGELEGQDVNVWNGKEWSKTTVIKTGSNQKLITVKTSSNQNLDCTEYHKFYVQTGYGRNDIVEKRAYELKVGDKLIKFDLPDSAIELHEHFFNAQESASIMQALITEIDWQQYQNSFILTNDNGYRVINLIFFKKLTWN